MKTAPIFPWMRQAPLVLLVLLAAGAVQAQSAAAGGRGPTGQLVYPARHQAPAQIDRDRFECHEWARQQSGFDPTQPAPVAVPAGASASSGTPAPASPGGLLQGAAGGAAVAELADRDAGKGAAVGALGASLRQQVRQRQSQGQQQQAAAQQAAHQQAARAQARGAYERGFAACMEGRGYVVK